MSDLADYDAIKNRHIARPRPNGHDRNVPTLPTLPPIHEADVARWRDRQPADIVFTIEDLAPQGMVTLLTGEGGAGKTLLMQMAGTVVAAGGGPFLGKAVITGRAAGVFGEDPEVVLHLRQPRINGFLGINYDLIAGRYFPQSYFGLPTQLWRDGMPTPFFADLENQLAQIKALRLLTLDNTAALYADDENSRPEVTAFMSALNGLADRLGIAIVLSAHPSKSQDGSLLRVTSGSTAWPFASRSVLEVKTGAKDDGPSLVVVKANHAPSGPATAIPLQWRDNLLVPEAAADAGGLLDWMKKRTSEQVFVDLLRKTEIEGRHVSDAQNASTYAPRIFARRPDNEKHKLAQFEHAMEKLFAEGRIKVAEEKRRRRIVYLGDDAQCSVNI